MAFQLMNNTAAVMAGNVLSRTTEALQQTMSQLSSGSRVSSGADDATAIGLVNQCQAGQQALTQSKNNLNDGVGFLRVADGALQQTTSLLTRAITLATEASNGTLNPTQLASANQEYQSLLAEIMNIGSTTSYNQRQVFGQTLDVYVGDASTSGASLDKIKVSSLSLSTLGETNGQISYSAGGGGTIATLTYTSNSGADLSGTNLSSQTAAQSALALVNLAVSDVAAQDEYLGSQINLLDAEGAVATTQCTSIAEAQNAIQATDYATAATALSRSQILMQTGISALSQANSAQQEVSKLLS